jgi:hypothetical protein
MIPRPDPPFADLIHAAFRGRNRIADPASAAHALEVSEATIYRMANGESDVDGAELQDLALRYRPVGRRIAALVCGWVCMRPVPLPVEASADEAKVGSLARHALNLNALAGGVAQAVRHASEQGVLTLDMLRSLRDQLDRVAETAAWLSACVHLAIEALQERDGGSRA